MSPRGATSRRAAEGRSPQPAPNTSAEVPPPPASHTVGRRVEYLPLASLVPDPRNPKGHDDNQIDASVGRFGFIDPVVRDERTLRIISGHGRTDTLKEMERRGESPPDGVHTAADGSWLVPVVTGWASRSDTEAAAALIALNRSTELGGWVDDALLDLLGQLTDEDPAAGLLGVGFSDRDIEMLQRRLDSEAVWDGTGGGADALLDEFRDVAGLDPDDKVAYNPGYLAKVTVEMRDEAAIAALKIALGLDGDDRNDAAGFAAVKWKRYRHLAPDANSPQRTDSATSQAVEPPFPSAENEGEIDRAAREVVAS